MKFFSVFLLVAVLAFVAGGCKDENNPTSPGSTSTSYVGVIAGTGVSGTLSVTVPAPKRAFGTSGVTGDTVAVTATLKINGGATIALAGYLVISTGEIYFSGGGYTFAGYLDEGEISGTFTYSGGSGIFQCSEGSAANVRSYCGTYHDNAPGTESGYFNVTINGSALAVVVYPSDGGGQWFSTTGSINASNQISIYDPLNSGVVVATGTLNPTTNTISGVYAGDPGGTWSGGLCN